MAKRIAVFRIDQHEQVGERLRVDGHLSRTGIQIYSDGFGGKRREYRDPSEVFHEDALRSFRAMPVTIQHPDVGMVTSTNWQDHAVGHVGDDVRQDDQLVAASLWLHRQDAIQKVRSGDLQELSVGYTASLDETPGEVNGEKYDARQTEIRGNHVALLKSGQARGGRSVRIRLDSNGDAIIGDPMKIKINGLEFEIEDPNLSKALEQERADSEKILKEAESAKTQAEARADAAEGKVKTLETELKTFRADQAKKERAELVEAARSLSKDLKIDKETPDEIRRMALESKGIKLDGKSDEYVRFRFEHELETNTPVDKVREVLHEDDNDSAEIFSIDRAVKGW